LAQFGHDRDGKKGLPIIVYGVMRNGEGHPVAVEVYGGDTGDPTMVADQVEKLREGMGLSGVVMVGDGGMLTQPQIDKLEQHSGFGWITAIWELVAQGALQLSLLEQKNLAEITLPNYPGERLMVCHNALLGEERRRKRQALREATEKSLKKIGKEVARRRKKKPFQGDEIGGKVGKALGRYKVGKQFDYQMGEGRLAWSRQESIEEEEKLDGIYVLRTSESVERLSVEETVRSYKSLAEVGTGLSVSEGDRSIGAADSASE
jgi:transposase